MLNARQANSESLVTTDDGRRTTDEKRIVYRPSSIVRRSGGFTLVELLVTAAILGIVALAVISSFASGLKVYERVESRTRTRPDILLSLEKMERDLRNTIPSSEIDFTGEKESVSFAALTAEGNLGRILYYLKGARDLLTREEQDYPRAVSKIKKGKGRVKELVSVKDIDFSYYYRDPDTEEYKWKDTWKVEEEATTDDGRRTTDEEEGRVPLGVKIKLTYKEGAEYVTLTRAVLIPVGYKGPRLGDDG